VDTAVSIWIVLGLIVLLMVSIWVILVGALAFGTWFIGRSLPSEENDAARRHGDRNSGDHDR